MQASRICESFADNGLTSVDFGVVIRFSFRAHKLPPEQQEFNLSRSCPRAKRFGARPIFHQMSCNQQALTGCRQPYSGHSLGALVQGLCATKVSVCRMQLHAHAAAQQITVLALF